MTDTNTLPRWGEIISKAWRVLVHANLHSHFDLHPTDCDIVYSPVALRNRTRTWQDTEITHGSYALPAALRVILGDAETKAKPNMRWLTEIFPHDSVIWAWAAYHSYPNLTLITVLDTSGAPVWAQVFRDGAKLFYGLDTPGGSRKRPVLFKIETPQSFRETWRACEENFSAIGLEPFPPEFAALPRGMKITYSATERGVQV